MPVGSSAVRSLVAMLAISAFQNRHKISEMLANVRSDDEAAATNSPDSPRPRGDLVAELKEKFAGAGAGKVLAAGLSELIAQFNDSGHREAASSWLSRDANRVLEPAALEQSLGEDMIAELIDRTGFSREELIGRLTLAVPQAVDEYSPNGRLPTGDEAKAYT